MAESTKEFTYEELSAHNTKKSLYISIKGKVYDVSNFIDEHPGGEEVLLDVAGKDATDPFEDVGHSDEALAILETLLIGNMKPGEVYPKKPPAQNYPTVIPQPQASSGIGTYVLPVLAIVVYLVYRYLA
uniref:Putative cytochrome b5 n=1 Tax=Anthurium amnicola TaxID=1678845 RepID=A0A1D1YY69_9ARAE